MALFIIKRAIHFSPTMPSAHRDFPMFGDSIFNGRIDFFVWVFDCHIIPEDLCCQSTTIYNLLTLVNIALGNFKNISNNLDIYETVVGIMANNFYALKSALSTEAQSKMAQKAEQLLQQLPLFNLCQAHGLSKK